MMIYLYIKFESNTLIFSKDTEWKPFFNYFSTLKVGRIGKGQLPQSQADGAGYENPGEDCGRPHQIVGVNQRFPVWLRPRLRHYRRNLCCQAAAREVSSFQQETLNGFCRPGEGIWSRTSEGHLVGAEKTWCGGVDCATGAGDVCKCVEPCPCWWGVQWSVWSEGWCSPRISTPPTALHHCAWSIITRVPLWGPLGGPLCRWPESLEECVRRLLIWKEAMEKKGLRVNVGKTKIMICGTGLDLLQSSGAFQCAVCRSEVGSNSIFCNGCKQWVHKKSNGLNRLTKDPDYRCTRYQGTARPLDGRQQKEIQVGPDKLEVVASFCYLGDMLSAAGGCDWTFNHNMCENRLEEVQGSATSSLFTPPLFQNMWPCVQLSCAERNAPCQWLGHWQSQTSSVCSEMPGQWSDRSAMSGHKTLSPPGPMSYLCGLALRIWTPFWRREDSDGMDMWKDPMVQSRLPLTYRLMESMGLRGPRRHGSSWQRGIAESGSSQLSTLMIDIPGDLVWDLPCVQQASYLEGGPLMWMLPPYLHVNQKSDYDIIWWYEESAMPMPKGSTPKTICPPPLRWGEIISGSFRYDLTGLNLQPADLKVDTQQTDHLGLITLGHKHFSTFRLQGGATVSSTALNKTPFPLESVHIFLVLHKKIYCRYWIESSYWGISNGYP